MKKSVIIFGMILFILVLKVNVYAIENNNRITENIDMIEKNNIIKENGIYKIATSQDIRKSIEIPGGNEGNNVQVGIWDYR